MARFQVRYHRAILDSSNRVMYPAGTIVDRLDLIPPAQHDKMIVIEDAVPLVTATVKITPAKRGKEADEEC